MKRLLHLLRFGKGLCLFFLLFSLLLLHCGDPSYVSEGKRLEQPEEVGDFSLEPYDSNPLRPESKAEPDAKEAEQGREEQTKDASRGREVLKPENAPEKSVVESVGKEEVLVEQTPVESSPDVPERSTVEKPNTSTGFSMWSKTIQPMLARRCSRCHVGKRFGFVSLGRKGATFTAAETLENYKAFLEVISLDAPEQSRLLTKLLPATHSRVTPHAGGSMIQVGDATYQALLSWIRKEKSERCADCGMSAKTQYLAFVEQPTLNWAIARFINRKDRGYRKGAKIMFQSIEPKTFRPQGKPYRFLPSSFCGSNGACDFGHLSVSHDGKRIVFECRLSFTETNWEQVRWNLCIAEIDAKGRAHNPRFLLPEKLLHKGYTYARSTPFGLYNSKGLPVKGIYDKSFRVRSRNDLHPVFSPDDRWVYFSSRRPDPRTGEDATRTYHGFEHVNNIIAVKVLSALEVRAPDAVQKLSMRTIYRNEGGVADFPGFLRNGNILFHTWNLERMDRHMYTQATADGMGELPVFFGRIQGPNRWGKFTQLSNGLLLGMTGHRRASMDNYVPFTGDHTLGTGLDSKLPGYRLLDNILFKQILPFPNGYCKKPPEGTNCTITHFYADPSYSPDGRAFVSYTPQKLYTSRGGLMFSRYAKGSSLTEKLQSLKPYLPKKMGIWLVDHQGKRTSFLSPPVDRMYRYPVWVGRRQRPTQQPTRTDLQKKSSVLHIADFPLWLSFRDKISSKVKLMKQLDTITSVRILTKKIVGNAGLNDDRLYRYATNRGAYDHPTHLGISNATGYTRWVVPQSLGGDAFGDVKLQPDRSLRVRLPADRLLLFQGIDSQGHVVRQRARVFALPPGHVIDSSVKRSQYRSQCSSCHGSISTQPFVPLPKFDSLKHQPMDFKTQAAHASVVDLTDPNVTKQTLTFLHQLRPILNKSCTRCHSETKPAGELSLVAHYSKTGNYPAGKWAKLSGLSDTRYMAFVPASQRVPAYNYSVSFAWLMQGLQPEYTKSKHFAQAILGHKPLAELAPWDSGYQNLFATDGKGLIYLTGHRYLSHLGRSDRSGGFSRDSFLLEVLTGKDLNSQRSYQGRDHTKDLTANQIRLFKAVIDIGFPFMAQCSDKTIPSGPNQSRPWCDPTVK